jgi:hypothetical protein
MKFITLSCQAVTKLSLKEPLVGGKFIRYNKHFAQVKLHADRAGASNWSAF